MKEKRPPLKSELARAICQVSNGKTAGPDNIPTELIKREEKLLEKCIAYARLYGRPENGQRTGRIPLS